jgi:hypothetical protein
MNLFLRCTNERYRNVLMLYCLVPVFGQPELNCGRDKLISRSRCFTPVGGGGSYLYKLQVIRGGDRT